MSLPLLDSPLARPRKRVVYPTSDGKPMAETDTHRDLAMYTIACLLIHFENRPDVYISGNNFIYFVEGDPKRCVSPDVYVVFGAARRQRDCYKAWEEGGLTPQFVLEFTSRKTRTEDRKIKRALYLEEFGVTEYIQFDPMGDYLKPRLQGVRRQADRYGDIEVREGRLHSEVLGLDFVQEDRNLRLYDPAKREWLLTASEYAHRADSEAHRAGAEALRAEAEALRAETERQRAAAAEAEVDRLREEIAELRRRQQAPQDS